MFTSRELIRIFIMFFSGLSFSFGWDISLWYLSSPIKCPGFSFPTVRVAWSLFVDPGNGRMKSSRCDIQPWRDCQMSSSKLHSENLLFHHVIFHYHRMIIITRIFVKFQFQVLFVYEHSLWCSMEKHRRNTTYSSAHLGNSLKISFIFFHPHFPINWYLNHIRDYSFICIPSYS